jgi:hypothetical protein
MGAQIGHKGTAVNAANIVSIAQANDEASHSPLNPDYYHGTANSQEEWVSGEFHTNSAERYFSHFKAFGDAHTSARCTCIAIWPSSISDTAIASSLALIIHYARIAPCAASKA